MPVIEASRVGFKYDAPWVLRGVSFDIAFGEVVGIIGPNGSGKTTLLKILNGILAPLEGNITMDGKDVQKMRRSELARLVAVVPQESAMVFPFHVDEMVLMGRSPHLGLLSFEGKKDLEIARRSMDRTGILSLAKRSMEELSGGERQRVWIARALAQEPKVLFLDEGTAFLDIRHQVEIFQLMRHINREEGLTVVAVTHDINLASHFADRIILMDEGRIRRIGAPGDVISASMIEEVYGLNVLVDQHPQTGLPRVTLSYPSP
ncbi:MAG: heme ABC transporter ATP-binding protein [Syntrophales bacterium]|jgi:iron complex transport system ATP-binding protein